MATRQEDCQGDEYIWVDAAGGACMRFIASGPCIRRTSPWCISTATMSGPIFDTQGMPIGAKYSSYRHGSAHEIEQSIRREFDVCR
jgi:hypothetical protein